MGKDIRMVPPGEAVHCDLQPELLQQALPAEPGVYLFKDRQGRTIYIGKAKSLRKRVLSYFKPPQDLPHKTALMMKRACALDFIVTATEKEAFILERNLVEEEMPRYNIVLRDDKQYPCLRLDVRDPYPRLSIARRIKKDGAVYFGPFASANAVRRTLKVIDRVFQLRKCKGKGFSKQGRACLNFQMDRCLAPCTRAISPEDYQAVVHQVRLFLQGRNRELIACLRAKMRQAAEDLDFEYAARLRDQITAIEKTVERQHIVSPRMEDRDVIGLAVEGGTCQVVVLFVRGGYLRGSRNYRFEEVAGTPPELMAAFLKQYYPGETFAPSEILISERVEDLEALGEWFRELLGRKIALHHPLRGEKRRLVAMAVTNAEMLLRSAGPKSAKDVLFSMRSLMRLERLPRRIEGMDISNFHGDLAVGTTVSFVDGAPDRAGYRNYRIRLVEGIDDYGMMAELASRRLAKGHLPDLFLIDGGKGHLAAVQRIVDEHRGAEPNGLKGGFPAVVALAKPDEERRERVDKIYLPGRKNPLLLPPGHPVLSLLMRIRDEAHRRAVTYHRQLRRKRLQGSRLDQIPGVGPARRRTLLTHFGDLQAVARASVEELHAVPGISPALAERIHRFLDPQPDGADIKAS